MPYHPYRDREDNDDQDTGERMKKILVVGRFLNLTRINRRKCVFGRDGIIPTIRAEGHPFMVLVGEKENE